MLIIIILSAVVTVTSAGPPSSSDLSERLRSRIEAGEQTPHIVGESKIYCIKAALDFYERRTFRPAWCGRKGPLPIANELLKALQNSFKHGLQPTDYHYNAIKEKLGQPVRNMSVDAAVDIELLLTDAFMLYGSHLLSGQVNPETIDSEWFANRRGADMATVLEEAIEKNTVAESLEKLAPPQSGYRMLRDALQRYRRIAKEGGWGSIAGGPVLKRGISDPRVPDLRRRLLDAGDLSDAGGDSTFDEGLEHAVKRFQGRYGLDADGAVGPITLAVLNVTVQQHIRQIMVNMERWRWLPQDLGDRHVIINIANFQLIAVDGDQVSANMRVIVGRDYRRTPVFSDEISYLVFNPIWEVPRLIAVEDILPLVQEEADYLQRLGFDVLLGWGSEEKTIDPAEVDWASLSKTNFPYRLRQRPGASNALGRVKFIFPNKFSVYLHDTPARDLFARTERLFSSGCIRVEQPLELAVFLFDDSKEWQREDIQAAMISDSTRAVRLPKRVPIHVLYWTAWSDSDGTLNFRRDIYGRDARLDAALKQDPPEGD